MDEREALFSKENMPDLKLVIALNRSVNTINRRLLAVLKRRGLTMMQFAVLEALYHKGDMKIGQLIEKVLTTGGNMTVVINNLAKEKLIQKRCDPTDSRAFIISITEKGAQRMREIFPEYVRDLGEAMDVFTDAEKQGLVALLKKLSK